jgi:hypothetical protein
MTRTHVLPHRPAAISSGRPQPRLRAARSACTTVTTRIGSCYTSTALCSGTTYSTASSSVPTSSQGGLAAAPGCRHVLGVTHNHGTTCVSHGLAVRACASQNSALAVAEAEAAVTACGLGGPQSMSAAGPSWNLLAAVRTRQVRPRRGWPARSTKLRGATADSQTCGRPQFEERDRPKVNTWGKCCGVVGRLDGRGAP